MDPWLWLLVPLSYLIGTFPSAEIAARLHGIDIRLTGSGNPGASNVTRTLGWKWGAAVMLLDALKGALPTAVGLATVGRPFAYVLLISAILGHMFPIWRGLHGGKGVATAGGGLVVLVPIAGIVGVITWLVVSKVTGKASLASLSLMALSPLGVGLETHHWWEVFAATGIAVLVASRHTSNIKRLIAREEASISH